MNPKGSKLSILSNILKQSNNSKRKRIVSNNSFLLRSVKSKNSVGSKNNLFKSSDNFHTFFDQQSQQKSKNSSHANLIDNGKKGCIAMNKSNIFDQLQNTQLLTKPPSICSFSNNDMSQSNLLKLSPSITDFDPEYAQKLLRIMR